MTGAFDNIHPGLSQGDAIRLLSTPLEELESQSDPYMAAAHLINFPGRETETALIALVMDAEQAQPRKLARRKAVEVLGRLGCCLLYTSPSPRDKRQSRMPSSA